ncbi:hypothetical protein GLE_3004 [Lysobacter enzymogenes]|uniref:Uncharacterized protein n=1 Tax=Lysobacter enzymogenes TaxID=69 RepID=A0A0S2DIN4_LYSEN|nr:hypothetical protein GLE_3004 [Lysobacter enzymogenes]
MQGLYGRGRIAVLLGLTAVVGGASAPMLSFPVVRGDRIEKRRA